MKLSLPVLLACAGLALSLPVQAAGSAGAHDHPAHGKGEPQALELKAGKKWVTDAPLRQAMADINKAMGAAVPQIHKDRFGEAEYGALSKTIQQKIAYAIEHCRLEPKADAMLHVVIADLQAGAETMAGHDASTRHDGAAQVMQALRNYGSYFRHPGWKSAGG